MNDASGLGVGYPAGFHARGDASGPDAESSPKSSARADASAEDSGARSAGVPIDAHVHIHECLDLATFLDTAAANFAAASGDPGPPPGFPAAAAPRPRAADGVLLLTEGEGEDRFAELVALAGTGAAVGGWTFAATAEDRSLTTVRASRSLAIVAGRQVATRDGLEVLFFGTRERFAAAPWPRSWNARAAWVSCTRSRGERGSGSAAGAGS
jgi:hypothetical protein